MGEEPYYIDKLSDYIETNILSEEEKGFNQTVMYGRDVSVDDIVSTAKRYPMMAERQVVIVKEAQDLTKTIDRLEGYAENPMASTVLVLCYKYKTLDKRKKVTKMIAKSGVIFEMVTEARAFFRRQAANDGAKFPAFGSRNSENAFENDFDITHSLFKSSRQFASGTRIVIRRRDKFNPNSRNGFLNNLNLQDRQIILKDRIEPPDAPTVFG